MNARFVVCIVSCTLIFASAAPVSHPSHAKHILRFSRNESSKVARAVEWEIREVKAPAERETPFVVDGFKSDAPDDVAEVRALAEEAAEREMLQRVVAEGVKTEPEEPVELTLPIVVRFLDDERTRQAPEDGFALRKSHAASLWRPEVDEPEVFPLPAVMREDNDADDDDYPEYHPNDFPVVPVLPPLDGVWEKEVADGGESIWGRAPVPNYDDIGEGSEEIPGWVPVSTLIPVPPPRDPAPGALSPLTGHGSTSSAGPQSNLTLSELDQIAAAGPANDQPPSALDQDAAVEPANEVAGEVTAEPTSEPSSEMQAPPVPEGPLPPAADSSSATSPAPSSSKSSLPSTSSPPRPSASNSPGPSRSNSPIPSKSTSLVPTLSSSPTSSPSGASQSATRSAPPPSLSVLPLTSASRSPSSPSRSPRSSLSKSPRPSSTNSAHPSPSRFSRPSSSRSPIPSASPSPTPPPPPPLPSATLSQSAAPLASNSPQMPVPSVSPSPAATAVQSAATVSGVRVPVQVTNAFEKIVDAGRRGYDYVARGVRRVPDFAAGIMQAFR